jgi:microcystin-dependent protein
MAYLGEIKMFAGSFAPIGWLPCDGSTRPIASYPALAAILKPTFGGDSTNFTLPDLRGRAPMHVKSGVAPGSAGGSETVRLLGGEMAAHTHSLPATEGSATTRSGKATDRLAESQSRIYGSSPNSQMSLNSTSSVGSAQPHENMQPSLPITFIINASGLALTQGDDDFPGSEMLAEIKLFAGNFAPKGFAKCEGQLLPISQFTVIFSLLGTLYGGNGTTALALPDLRGNVPIGAGSGGGLTTRTLGQNVGSSSVTLTNAQLPAHSHPLTAVPTPATTNDPGGNVLAVPNGGNLYAPTGPQDAPLVPMAPSAGAGGGQPHNNMQPYLPVTFIIALTGVFPARP